MLDDNDLDSEFDRKTPFQRYGLPAAAVLFMVVCGASAYTLLKGASGPAARPHNEPRITQVQLPPPPPPPPPPKTPPPPKKAEDTPKQREPTPQKAVSKPAPKAPAPPAAVTTSITGAGPGSLAAGNGGGGDCIGTGCSTNGDGSGGDNDAYYSTLLQQRLKDILSNDDKLKYAKFRLTVAFSLDAEGRIVQPEISSFSGDDDTRAEVERVLRSTSTGEKPQASIVGRKFTVNIREHARG